MQTIAKGKDFNNINNYLPRYLASLRKNLLSPHQVFSPELYERAS